MLDRQLVITWRDNINNIEDLIKSNWNRCALRHCQDTLKKLGVQKSSKTGCLHWESPFSSHNPPSTSQEVPPVRWCSLWWPGGPLFCTHFISACWSSSRPKLLLDSALGSWTAALDGKELGFISQLMNNSHLTPNPQMTFPSGFI